MIIDGRVRMLEHHFIDNGAGARLTRGRYNLNLFGGKDVSAALFENFTTLMFCDFKLFF